MLGLLLQANSAGTSAGDEPRDFDIRIRRDYDARPVRRALIGAAQRLLQPECQRIFSDFQDGEGRLLKERLALLGRTPEQQLHSVIFHDGFGTVPCQKRTVWAVTSPGGQIVFVCSPQFAEQAARERLDGEAVLIHEMLHTLGLAENPPSAGEITNDVIRRCYPERTRFAAHPSPPVR